MFFKRIKKLEQRLAELEKELNKRRKVEIKEKVAKRNKATKSYIQEYMNSSPKDTRNKWTKIPYPYSEYQILRNGLVRNSRTQHIMTPNINSNGNRYYTLKKDDGSHSSVKLETLKEMAYGNKKYKSHIRRYKPEQLILPF